MMRYFTLLLLVTLFWSCKEEAEIPVDRNQTQAVEHKGDNFDSSRKPEVSPEEQQRINDKKDLNKPQITPIAHATFVMKWDKQVIYVDPVGGKEAFKNMPQPDFIFVTDIHGDHMDAATIQAVKGSNTKIFVPQAVADKLPKSLQPTVINNGAVTEMDELEIAAIPMYNLTQGRMKYHQKGRGNGYVLTKYGYRVYISGDTEDIPEMRNLENIDMAFVCMNLPYTMTTHQAASAVAQFAPRTVVPYHYRGTDGYSDINEFRQKLTSLNPKVKVDEMEWYPDRGEDSRSK